MAASKGTVFRDKPPEPSKDVDNRVFERRFVMVSQGVGSATTVSFSKIESIHCSPAQRSVREEGEPGGYTARGCYVDLTSGLFALLSYIGISSRGGDNICLLYNFIYPCTT